MEEPAVAVLADDLIWSTRLADLVTAAGRRPVVVRDAGALMAALDGVGPVIVDLTALGYDPIAGIEMAAHGEHRVLAVGQHDDLDLRKRALAAGADRVYAYRLMFERGATTLAAWLAGEAAAEPRGGDA